MTEALTEKLIGVTVRDAIYPTTMFVNRRSDEGE
jgi:hypothetical protein